MAKRKTATAADQAASSVDQALDAVQPLPSPDQQSATNTPPASDAGKTDGQRKTSWVSYFGSWADYEAGVKLIENRKDRTITIAFADKPSEAVRTVLKSEEFGFRYDPEDKVWYKRIDQARPVEARRQAEWLAFEVANMIRQEKGMELKKSPLISM